MQIVETGSVDAAKGHTRFKSKACNDTVRLICGNARRAMPKKKKLEKDDVVL